GFPRRHMCLHIAENVISCWQRDLAATGYYFDEGANRTRQKCKCEQQKGDCQIRSDEGLGLMKYAAGNVATVDDPGKHLSPWRQHIHEMNNVSASDHDLTQQPDQRCAYHHVVAGFTAGRLSPGHLNDPI